MQPLVKDEHGTIRFKENAIVQYLLKQGPFDMNHLACQRFSAEDREQFAQLIGYSLGGFGELGYVSEEAYNSAEKMYDQGVPELEARNAVLRTELETIRAGVRAPIEQLAELIGSYLGDAH
jgi:hypothetical protein